jgi:hypothetical protein
VKLAIVGTEERTRDLAPWDDESYHILVFNEWATAPWCKRWDKIVQIHPRSVYTSPTNDKDPQHWQFLQQKHGKPVYLQEVDPLVPDSVKYPLAEINREFLSTLTFDGQEVKNIAATVSYAVALGLYEGYEKIDIYGVELVYDLHYRRQQDNFAFWVGVGTGRKVPINLHCSEGLFNRPLYGYEEYMEYKNKLEGYIAGMEKQLADTISQANKIEGAIQFAKQLLEEEQKEAENVQKEAQNVSGLQPDRPCVAGEASSHPTQG